MDGKYIDSARNEYVKALTDGNSSHIEYIKLKNKYQPLFNDLTVHPEEEILHTTINESISDVFYDLKGLDNEIIATANEINNLMILTKSRLSDIQTILSDEKERLSDINLLCNKYTDFVKVLPITEDLIEVGILDNNIIHAQVSFEKQINYKIASINGNGYEGNEYVYDNINKIFTKTVNDTSKQSNIYDNRVLSYYEYSRITTNDIISGLPSFVNIDVYEAQCTLTLISDYDINEIILDTDKDVIVSAIYISQDGINFTATLFNNIAINNKDKQYEFSSYINGSGILNIKPAKYIKITLQSNSRTLDTIAHYKNI